MLDERLLLRRYPRLKALPHALRPRGDFKTAFCHVIPPRKNVRPNARPFSSANNPEPRERHGFLAQILANAAQWEADFVKRRSASCRRGPTILSIDLYKYQLLPRFRIGDACAAWEPAMKLDIVRQIGAVFREVPQLRARKGGRRGAVIAAAPPMTRASRTSGMP